MIKNEDLVKDAAQIVRKPSHYCEGRKYEPIDVFNDWGCFFSVGNCLKYISRCGRKDKDKTVEDLQKALFYINYEGQHTSQPANNEEKITMHLEEVLADWKLSYNLEKAIRAIYNHIFRVSDCKIDGSVPEIKEAAYYIQKEIDTLQGVV